MESAKENLAFDFEDLIVYQKSLAFVDYVYEITKPFPREEEYRLKSQFVRAAQSIALNIAEGSGGTKHEFKYFLRIAKRSIRECIVCSTIAKRQTLINIVTERECRNYLVELSKILNSLIRSIKTDDGKNQVREPILSYFTEFKNQDQFITPNSELKNSEL